MPNTAPQKNAPNRNKAVAPNSTKSAPNQVQERSVKASSQKNAAKNLEHFNVDPPKMKTSGGQMSVARREQMIREIDIYVQMVYERLILEAQSNGGNAGVKPMNADKNAKAPAAKGKNFEIDVNKLQKSDYEKGTVMGTWSKAKNAPECGHPQVPLDLHKQYGRICAIADATNTAPSSAKGKDGKNNGSTPSSTKGTGPRQSIAAPTAKGMDSKRPSTSGAGMQSKQR